MARCRDKYLTRELLGAAAACGQPPLVQATREGVAGIRFCYPETGCEIVSASFDRDQLPPEVDRAQILVQPGARVAPPPAGLLSGRVAFVTAVAGSQQECAAALDRGAAALRLTTTP